MDNQRHTLTDEMIVNAIDNSQRLQELHAGLIELVRGLARQHRAVNGIDEDDLVIEICGGWRIGPVHGSLTICRRARRISDGRYQYVKVDLLRDSENGLPFKAAQLRSYLRCKVVNQVKMIVRSRPPETGFDSGVEPASSEEVSDESITAELWRLAAGCLSADELLLLRLRLVDGLTQIKAAKALGTTRKRVQSMESQAIGRAKAQLHHLMA